MASTLSAQLNFADAARARRANLAPRLLFACLVCLALNPVVGWDIVGPWLLVYAFAQAPEYLLFRPVTVKAEGQTSPTAVMPAWRSLAGAGAVFVNGVVYASLAAPLWLLGGPAGGVCAMVVLSAAILNAIVSSPGSRLMLAAALAPAAAAVFSAPFFLWYFGTPSAYLTTMLLGASASIAFSVVVWSNLEASRRAEAAARMDSERRRREAEAAVASKSAYVAAIGHDLRTPISAILAGASELEQAAQAAGLRSQASLIGDAGRMMKALLDDFLDHAKLEAGRMTVDPVPVDLRALLAQTIRLWRGEAEKKGLKLRVEGARRAPKGILVDPIRLRQILNNLLSNAVKFTPSGSVTIAVDAWPAEDASCALRLQVVDTGPGMTREQCAGLFTPFRQGDAAVARNFGGTGLGLAVSRQMARLMGGELTALSREGGGATFTLALTAPLADAPVRVAADTPHLSPMRPSTVRILVADDHEINRRAISLVLQPLTPEIETAADGHEALAKAAERRFDLIFMDVRMPGLDGRDATRALKASEGPNRFTPVIAVTADSDSDDVEACLAAGMVGVVAKPIAPRAVLESASAALRLALDAIAPVSVPVVPQTSVSAAPALGQSTAGAPPAEAPEGDASDAGAPDAGDRPLRILVVDDHEINRRTLQLILEPAGAFVTTAADGRIAVEVCAREAFDVILMDVRMPELDGRAATRLIRGADGPNRDAPIIAVTAEVGEEAVSACYQSGMTGFIAKPVEAGKLLAAVVQAIEAASDPGAGLDGDLAPTERRTAG